LQTKIVVQQRNIKKKIETLAGRSGILKLIKITHKSRETKFPNVKFKPNVIPSPYLFPIDKNGKTTRKKFFIKFEWIFLYKFIQIQSKARASNTHTCIRY